jgi:hypothetical protein
MLDPLPQTDRAAADRHDFCFAPRYLAPATSGQAGKFRLEFRLGAFRIERKAFRIEQAMRRKQP